MHRIFGLYFEIAALIFSIVYFRHLYRYGWALLSFYLFYVCITEGTGIYQTYIVKSANNLWVFNPITIISPAFYGWILVNGMENPKLKRILFSVIATFFVASWVWYIGWGDPKVYLSKIFNAGSFIVLVIVLIYFYEKLHSKNHEEIITEVPLFWIATGVLIFFTGISLTTAMYPYLVAAKIKIAGMSLQNLIAQSLCVVLYTCIIIAIIKCRKLTKILST